PWTWRRCEIHNAGLHAAFASVLPPKLPPDHRSLRAILSRVGCFPSAEVQTRGPTRPPADGGRKNEERPPELRANAPSLDCRIPAQPVPARGGGAPHAHPSAVKWVYHAPKQSERGRALPCRVPVENPWGRSWRPRRHRGQYCAVRNKLLPRRHHWVVRRGL